MDERGRTESTEGIFTGKQKDLLVSPKIDGTRRDNHDRLTLGIGP